MQLTLLDANLWMLPYPFSKEKKKRVNLFLDIVHKYNPDIITLQEIWLNKYLNLLKKSLPNYYFIHKKKSIYNRSGLVTLSKIKPSEIKILKFPKQHKYSLLERIASKGLICITFPQGKLGKISIVNTHLYDPVNKMDKIIDKEEMEFIEKISSRGNWIIAGDLNMPHKDFESLNKGFFKGEDNDFVETLSKENGYRTWDIMDETDDGKLDYVLFRTRPKVIKSIKHKVIMSPNISDHYAILSKISLF